jgi:uncharacterized protein YoxC
MQKPSAPVGGFFSLWPFPVYSLDGIGHAVHIIRMNENPKIPAATSPLRSKKYPAIGSLIATAAMFLIVVLLWRDLSKTKSFQQELAAKNETLSQELANKQSELIVARTEFDSFKTNVLVKAMEEKSAKVKPIIAKTVEEPETLFLQEPTVSQTADGLVARFQFKPDTDIELPERVTLVARIPSGSEANILSLKPVAASHAVIEHVVNTSGKLAMIEGSPADLEALLFELTVSAPVKATVRGSAGIKDFEMDITPSGCTVRKL